MKVSRWVAGIQIDVLFTEQGIQPVPWGGQGGPCAPKYQRALTASCRWVNVIEASKGPPLFTPGGVWRLYCRSENPIFQFVSPTLGARPYKEARVAKDRSSAEILLSQEALKGHLPVDPLEYPLEAVLFSEILGRGLGAEVHACGVVDNGGRGLLLVGHSGAGKSTIARLWDKRGATILSDDRIVLRELDGRLWMFGTPWHGEGCHADPRGVPLSGVYFLKQADRNALISMHAGAAASELFTRSFPPFYSREALDFTLGFFAKVAREVPCYEFSFLPDESALDLISSSAI